MVLCGEQRRRVFVVQLVELGLADGIPERILDILSVGSLDAIAGASRGTKYDQSPWSAVCASSS